MRRRVLDRPPDPREEWNRRRGVVLALRRCSSVHGWRLPNAEARSESRSGASTHSSLERQRLTDPVRLVGASVVVREFDASDRDAFRTLLADRRLYAHGRAPRDADAADRYLDRILADAPARQPGLVSAWPSRLAAHSSAGRTCGGTSASSWLLSWAGSSIRSDGARVTRPRSPGCFWGWLSSRWACLELRRSRMPGTSPLRECSGSVGSRSCLGTREHQTRTMLVAINSRLQSKDPKSRATAQLAA